MSGRVPDALARRARAADLELSYEPAGGGRRRHASPEALRAVLARLEEHAPPDPEGQRRAARRHRTDRPCATPAELVGAGPRVGLWTHLYALRSGRGFGVGNTGDLTRLVRWAGERDLDFVGLNPLHATRNDGDDVSPYSPSTRLFRNPLYLDVTATPEWRDCAPAQRRFEEGASGRERSALVRADRIDYARSEALRREVVDLLWQRFRDAQRAHADGRGRDFARFVRQGGEALRDYATFRALEDARAAEGSPRDWRHWPASQRSPGGEAVRRFREHHADDVERALWEQFELERQLEAVAREAKRAGVALGLYQDLAVGSDPGGFDGWAFPDHFVGGMSLGAPPDDYAAGGQSWGLAPLHPWRVGEDDFALFRRILRAGFAHAGMLRIDHVLGLLRQWWVPRGRAATDGVYVRFPVSGLLSAIAEESRRAGAAVVGEDLGTVPRALPSLLARHGVLSCRVLFFQRDARGRFRTAASYPGRALATADTHDMAPLAGWWSERDLDLREELGELRGADLARARALRERDRENLTARLMRHGALGRQRDVQDAPRRCAAVHRFLRDTPAALVGLSLDDLAGEREPLNLPGVSPVRFPSWRRRMARDLDVLLADPDVDRALGAPVRR